MSNFVYDTFTDVNGTALTSHTGQTGATWTSVPSANSGIAEIESDSVIASNTSAANCYASGTPGAADYSVTCEINITTASSAVACGPLARCSSSAETYYAVGWDAGTLYLYKVVAGTLTVLQSGSLSLSLSTNYWLKISVNGSAPTTITAYSSTDGATFTQQLQATDSDPSLYAAGYAGLAANTGISILSITATAFTTTIAVNDANWWRTPLAYYVDGSTSATCNVPGNESRLQVGTTANGTLTVNCSNLSDTETLQIVYSVDDGPWTAADLTSASSQIAMLWGGSAGTHTFRWKFQALAITGGSVDRWNTPGLSLMETGFVVDSGAATSSWPPTTTNFLLSYGDSLCEGALINNDNDPATQDATLAYSNHVAAAFNANLCLRGLGGGGWVAPNNGNVPPMFTPSNDTASCWDKYFAGESLLNGSSQFATQPNWILCGYGTNDSANSESTALVTASVSGWLAAARAAAPSAYLFVVIPFDLCTSSSTSGSSYVAAILAGLGSSPITYATLDDMTIYQSSTDAKVFCLNLGTNLAGGMYDNLPGATAETNDGTHATVRQSGIAGARIVRCMQKAIDGNGGASGGAPTIGGHVSRRV